MMNHQPLIIGTNIEEVFHGLVHDAAANQQVEAAEDTLYYLVQLLASFTHTSAFYERDENGLAMKPLASIYGEAVAAETATERHLRLKRLGDVALFIAGIFSDSLNKKIVDVDYYIAMGGNAYSYLSDAGSGQEAVRWQMLSSVFSELADNFSIFVDLLNEVSEQTHLNNNNDVMRLYKLWLRTDSPRAAKQLQRLGVYPHAFKQHPSRH